MKKQLTWVWTLSALAVIASPLTLDHVLTHSSSHHTISRSIAADESVMANEEDLTHLIQFKARESVAIAAVQAPEASTLTGLDLMKESTIQLGLAKDELNKLESEFALVLTSMKDATAPSDEFSSKSEALKVRLIAQLANQARLESILKPLIADASLPEVERKAAEEMLKESNKQANYTCLEFDSSAARIAELAAPKPAAEVVAAAPAAEMSQADKDKLAEADRIIAEKKAKEEKEAKDKQTAEAERASRLCLAEQRNTVLTKQVTDLQAQQAQLFQVLLGINQAMLSLLQNQNQNPFSNIMGNYFQQGFMPNNFSQGNYMGMFGNYSMMAPQQPQMQQQLPMPMAGQMAGQQQYFQQPAQQQAQQPMINNYYYGSGQPVMGMGQQQSFPSVPGSFNFQVAEQPSAVFGFGGSPVASI